MKNLKGNAAKRKRTTLLMNWEKTHDNGTHFGSIWKYAAAKRVKRATPQRKKIRKTGNDPRDLDRAKQVLRKVDGVWVLIEKENENIN